jgi:hypothetical protein
MKMSDYKKKLLFKSLSEIVEPTGFFFFNQRALKKEIIKK